MMRMNTQKRSASMIFLFYLAGLFVVIVGLAVSMVVRPAQASPLAQQNPTETHTVTVTATVTTTVVSTPTITRTPTTTLVGTLPVARTGTPTALVPRSGADFSQPGGSGSAGMWIAIWLLGLLLLGYGLMSRLNKPLQ